MTEIVEHVGPDGEVSRLPAGERVLWSGEPDQRSVARYFLRERWVLGFVVLCFVIGVGDALQNGGADANRRLVGVGALSAFLLTVAIVSIRFFAWQIAATSKYVITDKRVFFNIGIVMRADANIPFSSVENVDLLRRSDGSADLLVSLTEAQEIPWLLLFPHMTWRGSRRGRPTFRALRNPQAAADAVVSALRSYAQPVTADNAIATSVPVVTRSAVTGVAASPA